MRNPDDDRTGLATVRWLRDPGDDASCGPVPCDVRSLHALLDHSLCEQVHEVVVRGVVVNATQLEGVWELVLGSASDDDAPLVRVTSSTVPIAARRPGAVVRAWGALELTPRFEVRLRAHEFLLVETSSPGG